MFLVSAAMFGFGNSAEAHFPWLLVDGAGDETVRIHLYFSERAEPDDPDLLEYLAGAKVRMISADAAPRELQLRRGESSWVADIEPPVAAASLFVLQHDLGVMERGGAVFLLKYYAKTGPPLGADRWNQSGGGDLIDLELVPGADAGGVDVTVYWNKQPAAGVQVTILGPEAFADEATTDEQGGVTFSPEAAGLYSIRARHIEEKSGSFQEKPYDSIRHYSTLALRISSADSAAATAPERTDRALPDLPQPLTSFGGAVIGESVYVYGGHSGEPHAYSTAVQSDTLWRLNLEDPKRWESIAQGPRLQGLALVAQDNKLYRIGGFTAKNAAGEEHDLWSQDTVACFDIERQAWTELPPLPEPRSSMDAAVLDGKIYVAGGWQLRGPDDSHWHETAWMLDLAADRLQWKSVATPSFKRRALALAAHNGKLYAVGGIQEDGEPTTRVDVFDPATSQWSGVPAMPGEGIEGFGCAAFANDGRLYVSTVGGNLNALEADNRGWKTILQLETGRFFHRMVPVSAGRFVITGGANFSTGKVPQTEFVDVP